MKYKLISRRITLLIYTDDTIDYTSSCQININGDRATIDTVSGRDFFKFMNIYAVSVLRDELGLSEIGAAVGAPMLRLIKKVPGLNVVVDSKLTNVDGIPLYWIKITFK